MAVDEKQIHYSDPEKGHKHGFLSETADAPIAPLAAVHANTGITNDQAGELKRHLKARHIQMISIGGVIGTGLFVGSGGALRNGGALGLLLGYCVMGSVTYSVMVALGEMIGHLPAPGGHITLARRFGDPALSFTMGWNYWYNWTIVLPAELSASALLINYWITSVNNGVWITVFLVVVVAINMGGARVYGEMEFWFAIIKVLTITGLIILGIVITAGGGPTHHAIGFQYWRNPGPFQQYLGIEGSLGRFLGFWAVLTQAAFSFIGTEITAIAAGEAKNPRRNLPKAIRRVYVRILLFYILGVFVIGILVNPDDPSLNLKSSTAKSPFVIAIRNAGIKGLPSVINAALLTSAWSAASSDMYTSSRALYSMALTGSAPKIFARTNSWGLPYMAVFVSFLFSLLTYMTVTSGAGKVFGYFADMTSIAGLLTWCGIFVTYLRWHKGARVQGFDLKALPFTAPLQPYLTYWGLLVSSLAIFFSGYTVFIRGNWSTATFVTDYLPVVLFFCFFFGYKLINRTSFVKPEDMDFYTGSRDCPLEEETPPRNFLERVWRWLA